MQMLRCSGAAERNDAHLPEDEQSDSVAVHTYFSKKWRALVPLRARTSGFDVSAYLARRVGLRKFQKNTNCRRFQH